MAGILQHKIRTTILLIPSDPQHTIIYNSTRIKILLRQLLAKPNRDDINIAHTIYIIHLTLQKLRLYNGLINNSVEWLHHFVAGQSRIRKTMRK
ncbi:hypothetical protein D3C80_1964950 [compost metagenome]